jgi:ribonuclease P protein component
MDDKENHILKRAVKILNSHKIKVQRMNNTQIVHNEAIKNIITRRSIRKYTEQSVEREKIEKLLKAAMSAPSAGNQQPWDFIVVTQKEIIKNVRQASPYAAPLEGAPLCIIVCADLQKERFPGNWVLDCSAATENILLAAHAIGLGAVWIGIYPEQDRMKYISRIFNLSGNIKPMAVISIGYPAEEKGPADRFIDTNVHWEKW